MSAQRPNILFILSDDQGAWSLGSAGNQDVKTPNLDRLAQRGIRFENFFCASPVCSPARASIMTGTMPSQHGIHDWLAKGHLDEERLSPRMREAFYAPEREQKMEWPRSQLMGDRAVEYLAGQCCYPQRLREAGYTCALFGKWHLGDASKPQAGFETWNTIAMGGDNYYTPTVMMPDSSFDILDGVYLTDYITDNALDYLKKREGEAQPFYLSVHYTAPHAPWGRQFHPDWAFEPFEGSAFSSIPKLPAHPWSPYAGMSEEEWEHFRQTSLEGYCAAVYAMDRNIGRLLDELERQGIVQDTLVIFTADNGMSMGHHGIIGKGNGTFPMNMYEEAVKVPFIVSRPGSVPEGVVEQGLFGHVDLFPTLCDYLDCTLDEAVRDRQPGRSFAPVLRGESCPDNEQIIICDEYGPVRMIRTREWKYVHRYPYGPHELYHLTDDPSEQRNLAGDESVRDIEQALFGRLEAHFLRYSDPEVDGKAEAVCGLGQTGPVGVRARGKERFIQIDNGGKA